MRVRLEKMDVLFRLVISVMSVVNVHALNH